MLSVFSMAFEITGKVALITGASSGLGYCIPKVSLQQGLRGVAILDVDETKGQLVETEFIKEFGRNSCIFIKTDVSNEAQVEDAFKKTIETYKHLDIVVNNAAVISELNWKKCFDINLPLGITPIYSITKQAIVALGRTFGLKEHYDTTKVKVITLCPGHMKTPMILEPRIENFNVEYYNRFSISVSDFPIQEPEFVAESLLDIMKEGQSGSVWVVEGGKPPCEVEFRDRFSMRKNC